MVKRDTNNLTPHQRAIVDACHEPPAGRIPHGMSPDELRDWLNRTFVIREENNMIGRIGTTTARVHELYWEHVGELQAAGTSYSLAKLKDGTSYLAGILLPDGRFERYCLIELEPEGDGYRTRRMEIAEATRATGLLEEMYRWLQENVGPVS